MCGSICSYSRSSGLTKGCQAAMAQTHPEHESSSQEQLWCVVDHHHHLLDDAYSARRPFNPASWRLQLLSELTSMAASEYVFCRWQHYTYYISTSPFCGWQQRDVSPMPIKPSFLEGCNHKHCRGEGGLSRKGTEETSRTFFPLALPVFPPHSLTNEVIVTVTPAQWEEHQSYTRDVEKQGDELNFSCQTKLKGFMQESKQEISTTIGSSSHTKYSLHLSEDLLYTCLVL